MRIGVDARFWGPEAKGLGRYTERLLVHLAALRPPHEFVVFLRRSNFDAYDAPPGFRKVVADIPWYTLAEQLRLPGLLDAERCDLMHFPHFNVPVTYRRPFVVTVHDLILLHYPTRRASTRAAPVYWAKHAAYRFALRSAVHRARHILTVSKYSKEDIARTLAEPRDRITVTYEAADPPVKDPAPPPFADRLANGFYLSVGNAYPHKNLEGLLKTFAEGWHHGTLVHPWVLVGRKDYFYDGVRSLAEHLGVRDHVVLAGGVEEGTLQWLYRNATAYCFPSHYEGFGLPGLEAMRAGTPVVSSTAASLPEVYGDAAVYVDPDDGPGWLTAVQRVEQDVQLRKRQIARGKARVERFSWKRLAAQTLGVYEQCLA